MAKPARPPAPRPLPTELRERVVRALARLLREEDRDAIERLRRLDER